VGYSSGFCSSSGGPAPIVVSIPADSCCLRVAPQYTPQRDPDLVELFADGMDYLLRVEKEFGSMGRWVATRSARKEDFYTQYHATYCAVMGLAECHFAQVRVLWASGDLPRGLLSCWCYLVCRMTKWSAIRRCLESCTTCARNRDIYDHISCPRVVFHENH
jgi:hypothetical protein